MSLGRLWIFLAIALPTLAALLASLQSVDLTYHIRAGGEILDRGAIPMSDSWTFTALGDPWTDQQWGAQVLFAGAYRAAGWTGLVILRALLVGAIFGWLFAIARRQGLDARRAAWLSLGAFVVSAAALALRPQLLGMSLLALVAFLVVDRRSHPNRLWAIPAIVLVWANVHGSFFLAPVVLGLAWLEDVYGRHPDARRLLVLALASAVAACVTPFGPAVWVYAVGLSVNPEVTRRITEWQPTTVRDVPGLLFYGSALAVVVLLARRGRPVPWPTLLGIGSFFMIGVYAARGIAWWPIGAISAVAGLLAIDSKDTADQARQDSGDIRRLNVVVAGAIVVLGVTTLPVWRPIDPGTLAPSGVVANAPSGITLSLRRLARPGDRLLNPQVWGSWFEFALPDLPVAIDSRIEFFEPQVWDAYDTVAGATEESMTQLRQWGVTIAVVAAPDRRLVDRLGGLGWGTAYEDSDGWIMLSPDR